MCCDSRIGGFGEINSGLGQMPEILLFGLSHTFHKFVRHIIPKLCVKLGLSREKPSLRLFENEVLRRMFGPKRNEVKREWRRLRNEELYDLYSPYVGRAVA